MFTSNSSDSHDDFDLKVDHKLIVHSHKNPNEEYEEYQKYVSVSLIQYLDEYLKKFKTTLNKIKDYVSKNITEEEKKALYDDIYDQFHSFNNKNLKSLILQNIFIYKGDKIVSSFPNKQYQSIIEAFILPEVKNQTDFYFCTLSGEIHFTVVIDFDNIFIAVGAPDISNELVEMFKTNFVGKLNFEEIEKSTFPTYLRKGQIYDVLIEINDTILMIKTQMEFLDYSKNEIETILSSYILL
eukprot:gene8500-324_t